MAWFRECEVVLGGGKGETENRGTLSYRFPLLLHLPFSPGAQMSPNRPKIHTIVIFVSLEDALGRVNNRDHKKPRGVVAGWKCHLQFSLFRFSSF